MFLLPLGYGYGVDDCDYEVTAMAEMLEIVGLSLAFAMPLCVLVVLILLS